ncbi:hypothetical protein J7L48_03160 [bacterium]|nr:hypothetical protein [bacterium]
MKVKKYVISFFIVTIFIFFIGCYSDIPSIKTNFKGVAYNPDKSKVVFYFGISAYLRAEGITAFPDGGIPKYVLVKNGAYIYDLKTKTLQNIIDYDHEKYLFRNNQIATTIFKEKYIILSLQTYSHTHKKESISNKLGIFRYDLITKKMSNILPEGFKPALSPDEKKILYICSKKDYKRELHLYDLLTKQDEKIPAEFIHAGFPVKWLDSDNFVYCSSPKKGIWKKMNIKTKEIINITPSGLNYIYSPDKKHILYYTYKMNYTKDLHLYNVKTKEDVFITSYLIRNDFPILWIDNKNFEYCKKFAENDYVKINDWECYNVITNKGKKIKPKKIEENALGNFSLPLSEFGITVDKIIKKSRSGYISDLISLKGSLKYRILVIDHLQKKYDNRYLKKLLKKISKEKNRLKGKEKETYIKRSRSTIEYIKKRLEK